MHHVFWLWDTVCCTVCVYDWFVTLTCVAEAVGCASHKSLSEPSYSCTADKHFCFCTVKLREMTETVWELGTVTHLMWPKNKVRLCSTPWVKPVYVPLIQSTELSRIYKHPFWIIYHGIILLSITTLFLMWNHYETLQHSQIKTLHTCDQQCSESPKNIPRDTTVTWDVH